MKKSPLSISLVASFLATWFLSSLTIVADQAVVSATDIAALAERIDARFDDPNLAESHWGVLIESAETGEIWYERNADRTFVPASNQKILVAAASYRSLGPDFQFTTTIGYRGNIRGNVLHGDLVVRGDGDPTVYNKFYAHSHDVFRGWAKELQSMGIRRITGNIIGDDDAWVDKHTGQGWPIDEITPWYFAEYGPLSFNENYVDLRIIPPAEVGGAVIIEPYVECSYYTLINKIEVVASGRNQIRMSRPMFTNTITLGGTVVAGTRPFEQTPTITNPTLFYVTALKEVLEDEGIRVGGDPVDCDDLEDWDGKGEDLPVLLTHKSRPLSDIVPLFMKRSQNMTGENLLHAMGQYKHGFGSFRNGQRVIQDELAAFGLDPDRYRIADGSGLSRYNRVTPRQINAINRGMYESDLRDLWLQTQAIAGVDGTLRRISSDSPLTGNVHAKTGTLTSVRSLSGFLTTDAGEVVIFSILNNGSFRGSSAVDAVSHSVLEMVIAGGVN